MGDIIKDIFSYLKNKSVPILYRIGFGIFIFFCIFIIDDFFKFSYNYKINSQLSQIKEIQLIINNSKDPTLNNSLKMLQSEVLDTTSTKSYMSSVFSGFLSVLGQTSNIMVKNISTSPIVHFLSSNFVILIFLTSVYFTKAKSFWDTILAVLLAGGLFIAVLMVISGLMTGLINTLLYSDTTNIYIKLSTNILFQFVVIGLFKLYSIYNDNKEDEKRRKDWLKNKDNGSS